MYFPERFFRRLLKIKLPRRDCPHIPILPWDLKYNPAPLILWAQNGLFRYIFHKELSGAVVCLLVRRGGLVVPSCRRRRCRPFLRRRAIAASDWRSYSRSGAGVVGFLGWGRLLASRRTAEERGGRTATLAAVACARHAAGALTRSNGAKKKGRGQLWSSNLPRTAGGGCPRPSLPLSPSWAR